MTCTSLLGITHWFPEDLHAAFLMWFMSFVLAEDGHKITAPTVKVLKPSKNECRNKKDKERRKTIVCVASGFYPDHVSVSWKRNGEDVTKGVATDNAALRDGMFYKITSRLRVLAEDWFIPNNQFSCTVSFYNGSDNINYTASINGEEGMCSFGTQKLPKHDLFAAGNSCK